MQSFRKVFIHNVTLSSTIVRFMQYSINADGEALKHSPPPPPPLPTRQPPQQNHTSERNKVQK